MPEGPPGDERTGGKGRRVSWLGMNAKLLALALALAAPGCADHRHSDEQSVPVDQVPEPARKAAAAAVPGATFKRAEKEIEDGRTVYSLKGTAGGRPCEVEVTADGTLMSVEYED